MVKINKTFKILFIVFLVVALSSIVSAQVYEKDKGLDLSIICTYNGTYCSDSAVCNSSVINPEGLILVNNNLMSKQGIFFNTSLTETQTNVSGEYQFHIICIDNEASSQSFTFEITPSGTELSIAKGILYAFFLLLTIIFMLLFYTLCYSIDGNNKFTVGGDVLEVTFAKYIKIGMFYLGYLFMCLTFWISWMIAVNFLYIDFIAKIIKGFAIFSWYFSFPLFLGGIVYAFFLVIFDKKFREMQKRGFKVR